MMGDNRTVFLANQAWERAMFISRQKLEALGQFSSGTAAARRAYHEWDISVSEALRLGNVYHDAKVARAKVSAHPGPETEKE